MYNRFEIARLIGARALQIKMGAPVLIKVPKGVSRPIDIAKIELEKNILPITVRLKKPIERQIEERVADKIETDDGEILDKVEGDGNADKDDVDGRGVGAEDE